MTEIDRRPTLSLERKSVVLNGKEVRYLESQGGYSTHNPLVMIPGWPVSADTLRPLMEELGEQVKCYAVNLPGFGGSQTDYKINHTFSHYSDFIDRFRIEVIQSEKINFFGYSTGGVSGIFYSNGYAEHLDRLVLFSVPYDGPNHYALTRAKKPNFLGLFALIRRHRGLAKPLNRPEIKKIITSSVIDQYFKRYPKLVSTDRDLVENILGETQKFNTKAIVDLAVDLIDHDCSDEARSVPTPTLVISAENDEAVSPDRSERLTSLIRHSEFLVLPDSDHSVGIVEPDKMTQSILEFLRT